MKDIRISELPRWIEKRQSASCKAALEPRRQELPKLRMCDMGRPKSNRPTDAEMEILRVLWAGGDMTVRDVHDEISKTKRIAYTSLATIIRILLEKEMVTIVDARRPQKFRAIVSEKDGRKAVIDEWLQRLFGGSITQLIRHALTGRKLNKTELAELRKIIGELR